jgi:uncharacterized protein DUF4214
VVENLYRALLGRSGDAGGMNAFEQFLQNGGTVEQVEAAMIGSLEYLTNHGGGVNDGFLSAVYHDLLGRAIDPNGLAFFRQEMVAGVSRATIAVQLISSPEGRSVLVHSFYTRFLRRGADQGGAGTWTGVLQRGGRDEQVIAALMGSDEYFARL